MQTSQIIHVVSCHAEGEVGDVIVGGVAPPVGATLWQQSRNIATDNTLRNFMLNEPRGGVFRHVNLLVPPIHESADAAFIIMEPEDTPPMSGSNSICVATVLLETGLIPKEEPETIITLEAPGGLIRVRAQVTNGRVVRIAVRNVASFAGQLDAKLEVPGIGTLMVDTAYGGDSFVIADAKALGFSLVADEAKDLAEIGIKITTAANEQLGFHHPENLDWQHISFCQLAASIQKIDGVLYGRNAVVVRPGKVDRSPTGTGCSARLAVLHAKGQIEIGDQFIGVSIIDSTFKCHISATTAVGETSAIYPVISGRAWITGVHQHMLDPTDPWPEGYRLSDTWPRIS
ncbi:MAG: hypothetical protein CMM56_00560 [Rhodospirillaceae bacterium]|nr:hypothetical protein [Rhodospirillaceae bacterium]|tara:strand:- start:69 stop:1100 length:1032 start_codon:yes stop_codon:yes gene_type:complete